jgi:hypothetical protein
MITKGKAQVRRVHELKTWPEFFRPLWSGEKTFELRLDDRSYCVGDLLILQEFDPSPCVLEYSGRELRRIVTYKLPGGRFGLSEGWCILGLRTP